MPPPPAEFFRGLGAEYDQQGNYLHNFLEQAEKMDDGEEVSELASLWIASQNCPWPDGAIEHGESLLARFPSDPWTPYVHYALAMAHDAKVLWTYPGSDFEDPDDKKSFSPLPPLTKDHERDAAIEHFKAFLDARPGGRVAAFTWTEAWRLLAGLPPYGPHWGCTGE